MKVDVDQSVYHEADEARHEFDRRELKHLRLMLRRLRFLEAQVRVTGGLASGNASGGAAFAEWEIDALEWALKELGFLPEQNRELAVSGNQMRTG